MSRQKKERAIKKIEIAIDKIIDIQDMGLGDGDVQRTLDYLNDLVTKFERMS